MLGLKWINVRKTGPSCHYFYMNASSLRILVNDKWLTLPLQPHITSQSLTLQLKNIPAYTAKSCNIISQGTWHISDNASEFTVTKITNYTKFQVKHNKCNDSDNSNCCLFVFSLIYLCSTLSHLGNVNLLTKESYSKWWIFSDNRLILKHYTNIIWY